MLKLTVQNKGNELDAINAQSCLMDVRDFDFQKNDSNVSLYFPNDQSVATATFVAKMSKLYPEDVVKAKMVDEILAIVSTIKAPLHIDPATQSILRENFAASGHVQRSYALLIDKLVENRGPYFVGIELTVADLAVYGIVKSIRSGNFDHVATNVDRAWPAFQTFINNVEAHPKFAQFKL
jgi:glutathione S-transferase